MEKIYQKLYEELGEKHQVFLLTRLEGKNIRKYLYYNGNDRNKIQDLTLTCESSEESTEDLVLEEIHTLIERVSQSGKLEIKKEGNKVLIAEPFAPGERLILLGGGHVSLALAEFSVKTGFSVTVVDDRPYFANRSRFPWVSEVLCDSFQNAIERLHITSSDYVVILTRGHRYDGECLRTLYHQPSCTYLGMIGSRRRVRSLKEQLIEEGMDETWLKRLYSPVGLDIGAVTPEEIAIAILAEIIKIKRKPENDLLHTLQSDIDMRVMEQLAYPPNTVKEMGKAVVTILETKGSVPRKAGAKMIVYEDGHIFGTIGGGCAEAGITGKAREIIHTGTYQICEVDMTGTMAEEGMLCGGTMKVLIENVI